jgi:large subunit ribosomal protein L32
VAVPKRKTSRSNTRSRRSQWKTSAAAIVTCANCREKKLAHTACPTCGTYAKRRVLDV